MATIRPKDAPAATTTQAGDTFLIDGATGVRALAATSVLASGTLGTGVATALATNVGTAGSIVVKGGAGAFTTLTATITASFGTVSTFPSGTIFSISNNTATAINAMSGFAPQAVIVGADNTRGELAIQSYGTAGGESTLLLFSARGTAAAPTHTVSGDFIAEIFAHPFDGTNFVHNAGSGFIFDTTEDTSPTNAGQEIRVFTTPTGTATAALAATFGADGSFKSPSPTGGLGYATGAGGAVTQLTSRTTGVTLNKVSGAVTLFAAAPAVGTWVSCTVTNSAVAATDTVSVSVKSGTNTYTALVTAVAAGSFQISFTSIVGTASDSPVINFNVIKGVTS